MRWDGAAEAVAADWILGFFFLVLLMMMICYLCHQLMATCTAACSYYHRFMELKELKWLWDNWTKEEGEEESGMLIKIVLIVEKTTFRSILFCQLQKICRRFINKDWNDCVEWKGFFSKDQKKMMHSSRDSRCFILERLRWERKILIFINNSLLLFFILITDDWFDKHFLHSLKKPES